MVRSMIAPSMNARILLVLLIAPLCQARVTRIVVESRQSPSYEGKTFGTPGAYERLSGHIFGEIDPRNPLNAIITDIQFAPLNAHGMVEYSATFTLWKPVDMSKASGVLIYDVPNRGNKMLLQTFQRGDPGDGLLFQQGHVILASGWQGDVTPRDGSETIEVPTARNRDGSSIMGPVLARFSNTPPNTKSLTLPGAARRGYSNASLDNSKATLTRRLSDDAEIVPIATADWAFADCSQTPFPGKPDAEKLCLKGGFDPAALYELTYTAKDPLVLGVGLAATRDIVSFFRHADKDDAGTANPLTGRILYSVAQGTSQSGNFVKTMIHLGFNQDEQKRMVWDGANDHIAGRQTPVNFRFAIPGGAADVYEPGSEPALWWSDYADTARARPTTSMLARCTVSKTCPKIIETFGATEFWGLRISPDLVGTKADTDIPLPPNVRRFYFPGTTHGGGRGGFATTGRGGGGRCQLPDNPNPESDTMRALLEDLIAWVTKNTAPPESRYPHLKTGELVRPDARSMGFPAIPGKPLPDHLINTFLDYDFGPDFHYNDMSGVITKQPPTIRQIIPSLVPKVDRDGNEVGGVPSVLLQAPLGTYLGWNVTASGYLKGHGCGFSGGFIPFAATAAERTQSGDPRPSLDERYPDHDAYVARVKTAAERAVQERLLLREDADRLIAEAAASTIGK
jgi:hypothetical protein